MMDDNKPRGNLAFISVPPRQSLDSRRPAPSAHTLARSNIPFLLTHLSTATNHQTTSNLTRLIHHRARNTNPQMIKVTLFTALPVLLAAFAGVAEATSCNATSPCPASAPCCSEYGFCGTETFCLGGCNPFASTTLDSCTPEPLCKDSTMTFTDQSRILTNATFYDGNVTAYDWTVDKGSVQNSNGALALILTETNGGTRLSSTRFVHYGTITTTLKTGRWGGVVTAFITMSDVKDEIDWEFPGANTTAGQSNYFYQGIIPATTAGGTSGGLTDTYSNFHAYTLDWQPDTLTWSIDGTVVRTLQKSDTIDASGVAHYPTTPARVQLSMWPAGINGTAAGTVEWAGGMIDWADPDYVAAGGQFYALVQSVDINGNRSAATPTILYTNESSMLNGGGRTAPVGGLGGALLALSLGAILAVNAVLLNVEVFLRVVENYVYMLYHLIQ
ncbi:glycoside hydrolase family 16 protein [Hypholoma sublateritium FD-334 SS-4]|uniref:Glycoside hydrolase family 16 protein n=1 Tax=Hypholoma sublateritium (strain FD-334 SS-4) TaxID=945553 RepID=A0A0D2P437_HYPSF|nr:glycoside hydrolase family 16 protein [Hypholoma sublateritium FD-334 SS-4]